MSEILRKLVGVFVFKDKASKEIDEINESMDEGKEAAIGMQGALKALGGAAALGAIMKLSGAALGLAIDYEQTVVQFNTMLGSAEKAKVVLEELDKFSLATPFEPEQVIQGGKTLLAFGFQAKELTGILKQVGDVASGSGKDFNELITIFGKARASGKVMTEDLNQLVDAGIPIGKELAKNMGVAENAIRDMASKGKIGFKDLQKAMETMSTEGGIFNNMMDKQSKTAAGLLSTLKGHRDAMLRSFGEKMLQVVKPILQFIIDHMDQLKVVLKILIPIIGVLLVAALFAAAAASWAFISPWIPFIIIAAIIIAIIAALILVIQDLYTMFIGGESVIGDFINGAVESFIFLKDSVIEVVSDIIAAFQNIPNAIAGFLNEAADYLKSTMIGQLIMKMIPEIQARAQGGPVSQGQSYLVGEDGPELFTPKQSGNITSNDALSEASGADGTAPGGIMYKINSLIGSLTINVEGSEEAGDEVKTVILDALNELSRNIFRAETGLQVT